MDDKMIKNNEEMEIDLQRLVGSVLNKAWLIALVSAVCAVAVFFGTWFFVAPSYKSSAMFYVNNNSLSLGETSFSITSADINASRGLVQTYIVILNTREVINDVIDYAGVDLTYGEVKGMISAKAVDSTEIFQVVVTSSDPAEAEKIADAISYILPKRISTIIEGTSAKVVDAAVLPSSPSGPNYTQNTMFGFLAGFALAVVILIVLELLDITIHTEEDVTRVCNYPVLAAVPDMESRTKGGYYYGYGRNRRKAYDKRTVGDEKKVETIGPKVSFAAAESYKLLRTKIQFSFADESNSRVIGISSAYPSEGKSLSAINLAYSLSELDKKVLLIDCDMRRPSVPDKLPVNKTPGLSDYLSGQSKIENMVQKCGVQGYEDAFSVITSGRTPPNPMELLSSARMEKLLAGLREVYDYIILDLPPVGEVGDALAVSKQTDGILVVVRQGLCDRIALGASIRQFEFVETKILGVIFNCITENESNRYYKRYYKSYYRRYYRRYSSRYYGRYSRQYSYATDTKEVTKEK